MTTQAATVRLLNSRHGKTEAAPTQGNRWDQTVTDQDSNTKLVKAALKGDAHAYTELIRSHDASVRAVVFGMVRDAHLTDDILQEAYLKAFRSLRKFEMKSSFGTWLHRIAYTTAVDAIRKNARIIPLTSEATPDIASHHSVEDGAQIKLDITAALGKLPERQRAVALLIDGHGYTYDDVAQIMRVPSGTIASDLHAARKSLRNSLQLKDTEQ